MTSSNALKCVVSFDGTTTDGVAPRKPFHLNFSLCEGRHLPKSLMYGSLKGTTPNEETTTSIIGGGRNDCKRISTLQSSKIQSGCEDSNSEDRFSLQIQYQLPYNMDSEVSEENLNWEGC